MAIRVPVRGVRGRLDTRTSPASTASSAARARGKAHGMWSTYMLSVDPGLTGTGVVYWSHGTPRKAGVFRPLMREVRSSLKDNESELVVRARSIAKQLMLFSPAHSRPHTVVIEFPEHHESLKGRTSRVTGSIDRLSFFIGVLAGSLPEHWRVMLPRVRDWKGQLPKDVVIRRMMQRYGAMTCQALDMQSHAWDALGIGEWAWRQEWMQ